MLSAIRRCIETEFSITLSDDEFEQIKVSCGDFDEIYDNCIAFNFFGAEAAVEFVGIENVKLIDIQKKKWTYVEEYLVVLYVLGEL